MSTLEKGALYFVKIEKERTDTYGGWLCQQVLHLLEGLKIKVYNNVHYVS